MKMTRMSNKNNRSIRLKNAEAYRSIVIMGTLTDPFCTMINVTSDPAISMVIARLVEGKNWITEKRLEKKDFDIVESQVEESV